MALKRVVCDSHSRLDWVLNEVNSRKNNYFDSLRTKLMEPIVQELSKDVEEYLDALNAWRPLIQKKNPTVSCYYWIGDFALVEVKGWHLGYREHIYDEAIHLKAKELTSNINKTIESLDIPILKLFRNSGRVDLFKRVGSFILNFPEFKPLIDYRSKEAKLTKYNYYRDNWMRALEIDEARMKEESDKIQHLAAMMFL